MFKALFRKTSALFIKTKDFHWHMWGPRYREFRLLIDQQGDQLFAMAGALAKRAGEMWPTGEAARLSRIRDDEDEWIDPCKCSPSWRAPTVS